VAATFFVPPGTVFPPILTQLQLLAVCCGAFVALGQFAAEARLTRVAAVALPAARSGTVWQVHDMAVMKIGGRM